MTPAPAPYLRNLVRFGLPGVVLPLALLFTLGMWRHDRSINQREINAYFEYRSRDAVARVEARLRTYEQALLSARGLFQANEEVTRKGFATFVAGVDIDKHYPGIQGIGFALVVPASELDRHLVQIRGQGFPDYSLRPEGKRAVYSSIIYLEPFKERNLRAFGYDMFAEPVRQEAMRRATDSGGPALSGKVQLVQETDQVIQAGFLLYVPVYQNGRATQTIEDRRRNLIGWVYAPFRMNDFMLGVLGEGEPDLDLEVFDGLGAKAGTQMFDRDPAHAAGALALPKARQNLSFAGHSWTVVIQALPGLMARHGQDTSLTVLGLGSLVSLLLGLTAFLLARHLDRVRTLNATLEQKVQERTQALGESEEAFRTVADYTYDWELWEDPGGALRYCSPSCERITSYPPDAFRADPNLAMRLVHPEDSAKWQAHRAMVHAATGPEVAVLMNGEELEFRLLRPDGEIRWIGHVCHPIHDAAGHFRGHRISNRDITERKQAELALRESDVRFQLMADHAPVLIWISGPDKLCTYFNKVWLDFTGRTLAQEQGNGWAEGVHPDDLQRCLDIYLGHFDQRLAFNMDYRLRHADGSYRWLADRGVPRFDTVGTFLGYIGSCVEITERKQAEATRAELEAQNRQFQKVESLSLMAGSIAHHFNNKLQAVMANLEVLSALPKAADPTKYLAMAKLASVKAAEVSRQMLVYLGNSPGERNLLFLGELCTASLPRLQQALPDGVTLESACPTPGPVSKANAEQLEQVLTNLVTNAGEAMGAAGGSVRLSLSTCPAAEVPTAHRFPIGWQPQGPDYACLEVADTGVGIASADIEKLFDPFFSTKSTGRGLGLSVVLGLVQAHGGALTVASPPGQGSIFRVYLPISTEEIPSLPERAVQAPEHEGGGTLLLVDDDEMLLESACALLDLLGFTVLTAQDGIEALEVFRQHQTEIRCVLTDLTMPRLDGWGLLSALRQLDPNLPVILASGYDKTQVLGGTHSDRPQAFLSKPFSLEQLRDALGQALVASGSAGQ